MRLTLLSIKRFRKIAESIYNYKKKELFSTIKTTLSGGLEKQKNEETSLMNNFLNLCATNIQKVWKGFKVRNGEYKELKK